MEKFMCNCGNTTETMSTCHSAPVDKTLMIGHTFIDLLKSQTKTDTTVLFEDGTTMGAHHMILCLWSNVFRYAHFFSDVGTKAEPTLNLKEYRKKSAETFLHAMYYLPQIPYDFIDQGSLFDILALSHAYDVPVMYKTCVALILATLNESSWSKTNMDVNKKHIKICINTIDKLSIYMTKEISSQECVDITTKAFNKALEFIVNSITQWIAVDSICRFIMNRPNICAHVMVYKKNRNEPALLVLMFKIASYLQFMHDKKQKANSGTPEESPGSDDIEPQNFRMDVNGFIKIINWDQIDPDYLYSLIKGTPGLPENFLKEMTSKALAMYAEQSQNQDNKRRKKGDETLPSCTRSCSISTKNTTKTKK